MSWDEAYDIIEEKVRAFQEKDGPESIISMIGTGRNVSQVIAHNQYANFGGPDLTLCFLSGDSCMLPRTALCYVVMGNQWVADMSQFRPDRYENDPEWRDRPSASSSGARTRSCATPTPSSATGSWRP